MFIVNLQLLLTQFLCFHVHLLGVDKIQTVMNKKLESNFQCYGYQFSHGAMDMWYFLFTYFHHKVKLGKTFQKI